MSNADTATLEDTVTVIATEAPRAADLATLVSLLQDQQTAKCDLIIPATKIRAEDGRIVVTDASPVMESDSNGSPLGVTDPNGTYDLTSTCDEGISQKLSIPLAYLRRMHEERPDLWDATVNGWLHGKSEDGEVVYPADERVFLLRTFIHPDGRRVARALLSDKYEIIDNLDILVATLAGVRDAGVNVEIQADLTDRKMYVRLVAPEVEVLAAKLLKGYRSPFASEEIQRAGRLADAYGGRGGYNAKDGSANTDVVNAGLVIKNSETGVGGWSITPRAEFKVCRNGLVVKADMLRGVHLGGRKTEGIITWSEDTRSKELAVITAKTRDAVKQFLDPAYVEAQLAKIAEDMGVAVTGAEKHVAAVAKSMSFAPEVQAGVFDHFIAGGQLTSGGVMQAVTSFAQTVSDADLAAELEEMALEVLSTSASLARAAAR